jgi:prolyl-tRNA synthetase
LGTKYVEDFKVTFKNKEGEDAYPIMGCFGIGITRLMGVIVEALGDEKGIVWPESVAPFQVHLIGLNSEDAEIKDFAETLYSELKDSGIEVLYDDRDVRPGEKFADGDLLGMPYRVVVSKKTKEEGKFEVVERKTGEVTYHTEEELMETLKKTA